MKTKELKKLKTNDLKELSAILDKKKLELSKLEVKILGGKEKNLKAGKNLKKEIAQILTIIREKSQGEKAEPVESTDNDEIKEENKK